MTAEEVRQLSNKTVSELVEIICQLLKAVERQEHEIQILTAEK